MKPTKLNSALIALAIAAVLGTSAHAQNLTYNTGDLLIGFEQAGSSNNYVVDLGSVSNLLDASAGSTLTFNLSASDLSSAYGSTWASNSQTNLVQWGVIGASNKTGGNLTLTNPLGNVTLAQNTLFYTQGELNVGTRSTAPLAQIGSKQNTINGKIVNFAADFQSETPSAGSTAALQASIESSSTSNSYGDEIDNQLSFGIAGNNIEQPASGSFTGPTNSALDLYRLNPTSSGTAPAAYLGNFTLASTGVLTFNVAPAAVPEPSSYAMALVAAATFLVLRRRKALSND